MATQPPHRSQAGGAFLSDVFAHADPETAEFMARHNALLERVTVLERALEKIMGMGESQNMHPPSPSLPWVMARVAREALDA